jgi:hypothetical protein
MKGPPITVTCKCGDVRQVPYGETWPCERCGRRWNTSQIPADVYWGIMREMRNYRLIVIGIALALGAGFGLLAFLVAERLILRRPRVLARLVHALVAAEDPETGPQPPDVAARAGVVGARPESA